MKTFTTQMLPTVGRYQLTPTFIVAMRLMYDTQVLMFSSSTSSDKSSMCDEKRGSPFFSKYSCKGRVGV